MILATAYRCYLRLIKANIAFPRRFAVGPRTILVKMALKLEHALFKPIDNRNPSTRIPLSGDIEEQLSSFVKKQKCYDDTATIRRVSESDFDRYGW